MVKFSKTAIVIASLLGSSSVIAAKYKVIELSVTPDHRQSFGVANNDAGEVLTLGRDSINYPFYFNDALKSSTLGLITACDISDEELDTEQLDAESADCLKIQLGANSIYTFSASFQKVGDEKTGYYGSVSDNGILNLVDIVADETGELTRSNIERLSAINNLSVAVGSVSAPYKSDSYTYESGDSTVTSDFFTRDYSLRAVVSSNGETSLIEPTYSVFGGETSGNDISDTGYVAGYDSVGIYGTLETQINDECSEQSIPENICAWSLQEQSSDSIYERRATVWKLGSDNQVAEKQVYELAFTPSDFQVKNFKTVATAVNDSGLAVGYGEYTESETALATFIFDYPLVFSNGETKNILQDNDDYDSGYAVDVNNSNLAVGKVRDILNGVFNDSMFIYDIDKEELITPTLFYKGSETTANSINENGMIVGNGEYEITNATNRRKHGYLYDFNTDTFNDLNDLISCDSEFEVVDAVDINNNNEIVATALKTVKTLDALGNEILDEDGNVEMSQVPVAVLLEPVAGGEVDSCNVEETNYERKGFSNSIWMISFLTIFAVIRRRFL
ncbi:DUF3466 family protein [Psychrosphaera haliotis]|nr:DUF3466 family protein [Psychrosphaera haliotis]